MPDNQIYYQAFFIGASWIFALGQENRTFCILLNAKNLKLDKQLYNFPTYFPTAFLFRLLIYPLNCCSNLFIRFFKTTSRPAISSLLLEDDFIFCS